MMFITFLEIGIAMSIVILLMLILSKFLDKKYKVKWKYYIWLLIAIRLIIPINYTLPKLENNQFMKIEFLLDESINYDNIDNQSEDFSIVSGAKENETENKKEGGNVQKVVEIAFVIWKIGFICGLSFYILNYLIFKIRIKKYSTKIENDILQEVMAELKIKRKISLIKCDMVESPMLVGFIQPVIYMPDIEYKETEQRIIFRHELTHYKRKDIWYKLILVIAKCIHWFNPLIHLMIKQANKDLEFSCDEQVIRTLGIEERKEYSRIILKTMEG